MKSLEFSEWIKLAETKNLFLGPEDYAKLTPNKEYIAVEADYIQFLFFECSEDYNILPNKNYLPEDLYQRLKVTLIPTGKVTQENAPVRQADGLAMFEEVQYYQFNMYRFNWSINANSDKHNDRCDNIKLNGAQNCRWLSSGSGDGYSRWILWDKLKDMPEIYFKEYDSE